MAPPRSKPVATFTGNHLSTIRDCEQAPNQSFNWSSGHNLPHHNGQGRGSDFR